MAVGHTSEARLWNETRNAGRSEGELDWPGTESAEPYKFRRGEQHYAGESGLHATRRRKSFERPIQCSRIAPGSISQRSDTGLNLDNTEFKYVVAG